MVKEHRFSLLKGSKKSICPGCGKKRFVPYIDVATGQALPEQYGRCDRVINCSYHLNPYSDGYSKVIKDRELSEHAGNRKPSKPHFQHKPPSPPETISFVPVEVLKQSRTRYSQNNFVQWLTSLFDTETVNTMISRYHIGTSRHWSGATVFWQIDQYGKVRSGKIMLYSPTTGKRTKEPFHHITWVHKVLKLPEFELKQCFFGTHLLHDTHKPVAIVESEKTAIISSAYFPQFTWLAVGSLNNLNLDKCRVLAGRHVFMFPDLNGFEIWSSKAKELSLQMPGTLFEVSNYLEQIATAAERASGLDLADYLIKFDYKNFKQTKSTLFGDCPSRFPPA